MGIKGEKIIRQSAEQSGVQDWIIGHKVARYMITRGNTQTIPYVIVASA